jgi:hypothetical protein
MENLAEYASVAVELLGIVIAVVFAVVPVIICRVQTGKFDLMKTLEAAEDVAHAVEDLDEGIKKIEELRGKKLSPKMKRKAKARMARFTED